MISLLPKHNSHLAKCPTCGQIVPPQVFLPKMQQRIYDYIARHPQGSNRQQIIDAIYWDDPNGGPDWLNGISVQIRHINKRINVLGIIIKGTGGPGSVYRLRSIQ